MAVDQKEVSEMARLIQMMNVGVSFDDPSDAMAPPVGNGHIAPPAISTSDTDPGVSAMKNILETFYSGGEKKIEIGGGQPDPGVQAMKDILGAFYAGGGDQIESYVGTGATPPASADDMYDPVAALMDRAKIDPELREAMQTFETPTGTRVGSWEIRVNEDARGLKSYDVVSTVTGDSITTELTLYDAAHGIVRLLNEGVGINNAKIRDILNIEAEYARARMKAAEFRDRQRIYESSREFSRAAVMEDRFEDALSKAKTARSRLAKISRV